MTPYRIIKTFPGSQNGNDYSVFKAGTERILSHELAALAVGQGWAEPVGSAKDRDTKVIIPAEAKIIAPEENKSSDEQKPFADEQKPKTLKLAKKA